MAATAARDAARRCEMTQARWRAHGELAFLLEGDLKEAARRAARRDGPARHRHAGVADASPPPVRAAHTRLLDVRDALHLLPPVGGVDRLLAQERDRGRRRCSGCPSGDALLRRIADDARTIAYAVDDAWRAVRPVARRPAGGPDRVPPGAPADRARRGGAGRGGGTGPGGSRPPTRSEPGRCGWPRPRRRYGLPICPATLEWLARFCPPLPRRGPPRPARRLLTMLGTGPAWCPPGRPATGTGW